MDKWSKKIGGLVVALTYLSGHAEDWAGWVRVPLPSSKDAPESSVWCQRPKPNYPAEWADAGEVGVVKIRVIVTPSEHVVSASVVKSSGFEHLDDSALAAAKAVRCRAVTGDIPSPGFAAIMPISFDLH